MNNSNDKPLWDAKCVENLIKRMNNELKLPYDSIVLKDFSDALQSYCQSSSNSTAKNVYSSSVLRNLLDSGPDNRESPSRSQIQ